MVPPIHTRFGLVTGDMLVQVLDEKAMTSRMLADHFRCSVTPVISRLMGLMEEGRITLYEPKKRDHQRKWYVSSKWREPIFDGTVEAMIIRWSRAEPKEIRYV